MSSQRRITLPVVSDDTAELVLLLVTKFELGLSYISRMCAKKQPHLYKGIVNLIKETEVPSPSTLVKTELLVYGAFQTELDLLNKSTTMSKVILPLVSQETMASMLASFKEERNFLALASKLRDLIRKENPILGKICQEIIRDNAPSRETMLMLLLAVYGMLSFEFQVAN